MWLVGKTNRNHTASENMFGFEVITAFSERFSNDKVFLVLNNGFVIHDGITLNKNELIGYSRINESKSHSIRLASHS